LFSRKTRKQGLIATLYAITAGALYNLQNWKYNKYESANTAAQGYKIWLDLTRRTDKDFGSFKNRKFNTVSDEAIEEAFEHIYMRAERLKDAPEFINYLVWKQRDGATEEEIYKHIALMDEIVEVNQNLA